jgi:alcohol dehydrogenase class IV
MKYAVWSDVVEDPTTSSIDAGVAAIKEVDGCDCLVAFGGGSPMDTSKAVGVLASHGGKMRDYKAPFLMDAPSLPVIAIPTTAGTGSEATKFTIITDEESQEKMLCIGMSYMPTAAIIDYELTMDKPWGLTAATGVDAMTHAIEAYVSKKANPYSDGMALLAMGTIYRHIRTACEKPHDHEAREQMMLGSMQAGMAFSNASVCLVHGMSRPIGAFFHVPHGLSNAMLLPDITEFSIPDGEARYATCARSMGVADVSDSDTAACHKLVDALKVLNSDLKIMSMSAFGIDKAEYEESIATMAVQAEASGSPANNPRVPSVSEMEDLYRLVYS